MGSSRVSAQYVNGQKRESEIVAMFEDKSSVHPSEVVAIATALIVKVDADTAPVAVITIRGGIADHCQDSDPVTVVIRDYDIDGSDDDLETDETGKQYHEYCA
jgi:hypothetical protein